MNIKLTVILVLIFMALIFILQNSAIVDVQVLFWTISISRILLMFIILIVGFIIGFILNSYLRHIKSVK